MFLPDSREYLCPTCKDGRSVEKVITILELEGRAAPGVLKRSTMQRHLFDAGFGAMHLETYKDARKRNETWRNDDKMHIYLTDSTILYPSHSQM